MDGTTLLTTAALLIAGLLVGAGLGYLLARSRAAPPGVTALLAPASQALSRVEAQLHQVERDRIDAYAGLREQLTALRRSSAEIGAQAGALAGALKSPQVRGRWGEVQLQRIVELAGMVERCDFDTQVPVHGDAGGARPDMVIRLAGGRNIPVDAKTPMAAWLRACEAGSDLPTPDRAAQPVGDDGAVGPDAAHDGATRPVGGHGDEVRRHLLTQHARAVRSHVDALAGKAYWQLLQPAPEFVVMFVPGEAFLDAALAAEPGLAEYAFERKVVIATPSTLIALLRTVAFTWRQERLSVSAKEIHTLGRELYHRLATFGEHLGKVGAGLDRAVASYNAAVRSLDSRVLVSARRFADLGVTGEQMPTPNQVDTAVTQLPEIDTIPRTGPIRAAGG